MRGVERLLPLRVSVTPPLPPIPSQLPFDQHGHRRNRSMTVEAPRRKISTAHDDPFESPIKVQGRKASQVPSLPPLKVRSLEPRKVEHDKNGLPPRSSSKAREALGLLRRLSLSRSSSRGKDHSRQPSQGNNTQVAEVEQNRPASSRRRLSMSWLKGKTSPFGQRATSLHVDRSVPPAIPKSFTSESLADVARSSGGSMTASSGTRAQTASLDEAHPADAEVKAAYAQQRGQLALEAHEGAHARLEAQAKLDVRRPLASTATASHPDDAPLNVYERGEVADYEGKVFFSGRRSVVKPGGRLEASPDSNFGYDDERGDYCIVPGDHVAYRYEIVDLLGKGSFGQVARCVDRMTGTIVAVKIIRNKRRFHAQALVEVKILRQLRDWVGSPHFALPSKTQD